MTAPLTAVAAGDGWVCATKITSVYRAGTAVLLMTDSGRVIRVEECRDEDEARKQTRTLAGELWGGA